jgi:hypothetical protein
MALGVSKGMAIAANGVAYAVVKYDLGEQVPNVMQSLMTNALIAMRQRIIANRPRGAIVMLTAGYGSFTSSLDSFTDAIFDLADTFFITAAHQVGNASIPSSAFWPQRHSRVFKIGSTNQTDNECSSNNFLSPCFAPNNYYQPPVQYFAPAKAVTTALIGPCAGGNPIFSDYTVLSGTSFAAPQIAANAAMFLGGAKNKTYTPHWFQVRQALIEMATLNKIQLRPDSLLIDNRLSYNMRGLPVSSNAASFEETAARGSIVASFGEYGSSPSNVFLNFDCAPGCGSHPPNVNRRATQLACAAEDFLRPGFAFRAVEHDEV